MPEADASIEEIIEHQQWLRRLARGLVSNEDDAEEVVQQTLVNAVRRPPRAGSNIRAWLTTVARRVAYRQYRIERQQSRWRSTIEPRTEASQLTIAILNEAGIRVSEAVAMLAEPYRVVVQLRYYENLEPRDIAARLGIPVETARTRLRRAKAQLREKLATVYANENRDYREVMALMARMPHPGTALECLSKHHESVPHFKPRNLHRSSLLGVSALVLLVLFGLITWLAAGERQTALPVTAAPNNLRSIAEYDIVKPDLVAGARYIQPIRIEAVSLDTNAGIKGRIVNEIGEPIMGAGVTLDCIHSGVTRLHFKSVSGSDGRFEASAQPIELNDRDRETFLDSEMGLGEALLVEAPGRARLLARGWTWAGAADGREHFLVNSMSDIGVLVLPRGCTIKGKVCLKSGVPVQDAAVLLGDEPLGPGGSEPPFLRCELITKSAADGSFELPWRVGVSSTWPAGYILLAAADVGMSYEFLTPADLTQDTMDIVLTIQSVRRTLRITDREGRPIEAAEARIVPLKRPFTKWDDYSDRSEFLCMLHDYYARLSTRHPALERFLLSASDSSGRVSALIAGGTKCVACIAANGFRHLDVPVEWSDVETEPVVMLERSTNIHIHGRVSDEHGRAVAGATLRFSYPRGRDRAWSATSGEAGDYAVDVERINDSKLSTDCTFHNSFTSARMVIDVSTPAESEWSPSLELETLDVSGSVVGVDGQPVSELWLQVEPLDDSDGTGRMTRTSRTGGFKFEGLKADAYSIHEFRSISQWSLSGGESVVAGSHGVVLTATPRSQIELRLSPG
jgi:RNA polymerase sigma factor (sigma-70 family)